MVVQDFHLQRRREGRCVAAGLLLPGSGMAVSQRGRGKLGRALAFGRVPEGSAPHRAAPALLPHGCPALRCLSSLAPVSPSPVVWPFSPVAGLSSSPRVSADRLVSERASQVTSRLRRCRRGPHMSPIPESIQESRNGWDLVRNAPRLCSLAVLKRFCPRFPAQPHGPCAQEHARSREVLWWSKARSWHGAARPPQQRCRRGCRRRATQSHVMLH